MHLLKATLIEALEIFRAFIEGHPFEHTHARR